MGNVGNLHVVENLYVGLCNLHADVVLRLFEVSGGSFEIQLVKLDLIRNLETRKNGHAGAKRERGRRGVRVRIGVFCRQTASEREVLTG